MEPTELVCVNGVSTESSPECTIQNVGNADVAQVRTEFNGKVETWTALINAIVSQVDLAAVRHDQGHSAGFDCPPDNAFNAVPSGCASGDIGMFEKNADAKLDEGEETVARRDTGCG